MVIVQIDLTADGCGHTTRPPPSKAETDIPQHPTGSSWQFTTKSQNHEMI